MLNQLRNDSAFVPELDYSLQKAAGLGCGALCFEGNIDFYGKSGFRPASEFGIRYHGLDEGEDASFFLCKELISGYLDGVTGEYAPPEGYFVDEKAVEEFDRQFLYKEVGKVAKITAKRLEKLQKIDIIGIEKLQMQCVGVILCWKDRQKII